MLLPKCNTTTLKNSFCRAIELYNTTYWLGQYSSCILFPCTFAHLYLFLTLILFVTRCLLLKEVQFPDGNLPEGLIKFLSFYPCNMQQR